MYEAKQRKERGSRQIDDANRTRQREKIVDKRISLFVPQKVQSQSNYGSCLQRRIENTIHSDWKICVNKYFTKINNITNFDNNNRLNAESIEKGMLNILYHKAISYIKSSEKGCKIWDKINNFEKQFIVEICNPYEPTSYSYTESKIYWNPFEFITFEDDLIEYDYFVDRGLISPASILLHEMGHVTQHIEAGTLYEDLAKKGASDNTLANLVYYTYPEEGSLIEFDNVISNEMPFNKDKNEPVRRRYDSATVLEDINREDFYSDYRIVAYVKDMIQYINNMPYEYTGVINHTNVEHLPQNIYKERERQMTLSERYKNYLSDTSLVIDSVNYRLHLINHEVHLLELNEKSKKSEKQILFNKIKGLASDYLKTKNKSINYINVKFADKSIFD